MKTDTSNSLTDCKECNGTGTVAYWPMYSYSSKTSVAERKPCQHCYGTGKVDQYKLYTY